MRALRIVKIGGSIATIKGSNVPALRRERLRKMAKIFAEYQSPLILILGAGSFGHPLAKKYQLKAGLAKEKKGIVQWKGALETHNSVAKLVHEVADIFLQEGLPVFPLSPAVIMNNGVINISILQQILANGLIPLLHGDVIFDEEKGVKIYSGDTLAPDLARLMGAEEIHYITRGAGVLRSGKTVEKLTRAEVKKLVSGKIDEENLESVYVDVTGGFQGKLRECIAFVPPAGIYIYDGTSMESVEKGFLEKVGGTLIF